MIGIASLAVSIHARPGPYARAFPLLLAVGTLFAVVRMLLTVATTHGVGDVLFTTPHFGLPQLLGGFTVGGSVELPIMLQSLAEGFAIVGIMGVFGAFNSVVSHSELVQSTPRAFYEVGLVVVVGLAFVPSTLSAIHDVRDADRARTGGRVVRRGRLLRQVVPVLELGLERAVTLAESMDARGFARGGASPRDRAAGWWGVASLLMLGGAFVALVGSADTVAAVLGLAGAGGLVAAILLASSGTRRVRYRPRRMRLADWLVAAAVGVGADRDGVVFGRRRQPASCGSPIRWRGPRSTCCRRWRSSPCSRRSCCDRRARNEGRTVSAISYRDVSFAYPDATRPGVA